MFLRAAVGEEHIDPLQTMGAVLPQTCDHAKQRARSWSLLLFTLLSEINALISCTEWGK